MVHGRTSKFKDRFTNLTELINSYKSDSDLCDLNQDVATLRALLDIKLDQIDINDPKTLDKHVETVRSLMRDIRYTTQQKADIEAQYLIPIENIQVFLQNVLLVLSANIEDKELLQKIITEIQSIRIMEADVYQRQQYGLPNRNKRR